MFWSTVSAVLSTTLVIFLVSRLSAGQNTVIRPGREELTTHMVDWMAQNAKEKASENRIFDGQNRIVVFN